MRAVARQKGKANGEHKMKLSKTILAVLGTGLLSCALFSQQAQAALVNGNINFAGSVQYDTTVSGDGYAGDDLVRCIP